MSNENETDVSVSDPKMPTAKDIQTVAHDTYKKDDFEYEVYLPKCGKVATFREGTAQDLMNANKIVGDNKDRANFCLLEELCLLDGEKAYIEDFQTMKISDFNKLMAEFGKINF